MRLTTTSKPKLYYFNPGHETAIHSGSVHYTPTAAVRKMATDLAVLPLWYGKNDDYVIVDKIADAHRFISTIPKEIRSRVKLVSPTESHTWPVHFTPLEAAPWGLSPQSIRYFELLRQHHLPSLVIPRWDDALTRLTHRRTAVGYLQELPFTHELNPPQFFSDINHIRKFIETHALPCIIKTPYSCSGRGIRWIRNQKWDEETNRWVSGALKKQQSVSIETAVDKVCDFAMEFESDGEGHVTFNGLSVFDTSADGAYNGNLLGSGEMLEKCLTDYVSGIELGHVQEAVQALLAKKIGTVHKGLLGVDMLIYRNGTSFRIHPLIELNLRHTMGHVSLQLSDHLIHPSAKGKFTLACHPAGEAYHTHLQMIEDKPLQIADGRICAGYFSLCPVTADTRFRAYVEINPETK
jgi:hypothetical protein